MDFYFAFVFFSSQRWIATRFRISVRERGSKNAFYMFAVGDNKFNISGAGFGL